MMAIMNLIKYAVLLLVVPYLNFVYWREYGGQVAHREQLDRCSTRPAATDARMHRGVAQESHEGAGGSLPARKPCRPRILPAPPVAQDGHCNPPVISDQDYGRVSKIESKSFGEYKGEHLIQLKSPALTTTVLNPNGRPGSFQPNVKKALRKRSGGG